MGSPPSDNETSHFSWITEFFINVMYITTNQRKSAIKSVLLYNDFFVYLWLLISTSYIELYLGKK